MKIENPFKTLTKFEIALWSVSAVVVTLSFILSPDKDPLTLCASLMGVSSLIFIAKGNFFGQILMIVFATLYGVVSFFFRYYGEMITYLGMSLPAAVASLVSWLRHPYRASEVKVGKLTPYKVALLFVATAVLTTAFYFILRAIGNANLVVSTVSVATSLFAAILTFMRIPLYALAYAANDVVLIVLWVLASMENIAYLPMIFCFVMFLLNDLYGFFNWRRMEKNQSENNFVQTDKND